MNDKILSDAGVEGEKCVVNIWEVFGRRRSLLILKESKVRRSYTLQ